jgi:hypothetical protein
MAQPPSVFTDSLARFLAFSRDTGLERAGRLLWLMSQGVRS